jgi:hypothetical protein
MAVGDLGGQSLPEAIRAFRRGMTRESHAPAFVQAFGPSTVRRFRAQPDRRTSFDLSA